MLLPCALQEVCLKQQAWDDRGIERKYIEDCVPRASYPTACENLDEMRCKDKYPSLVLPAGVSTTAVYCTTCEKPALCEFDTTTCRFIFEKGLFMQPHPCVEVCFMNEVGFTYNLFFNVQLHCAVWYFGKLH